MTSEKKKLFVVFVIAFFLGSSIGGSASKSIESNEQRLREREVVWKQLKETDDLAFSNASTAMGLCSETINNVIRGDLRAITKTNNSLNELLEDLDPVVETRLNLLKQLGY